MSCSVKTVGDSGTSVRKFLPSSQHLAKSGSNGREPRNSTLSSLAIARPPPVDAGNISTDSCLKMVSCK